MTVTTDLGKIMVTPKGEWDYADEYEILDVVTYLGSSYLALKSSSGKVPTDMGYWICIAEKGDTGNPGRGIVSVVKTSTSVLTDTYTVTYTDGSTTTFDVENGNGIVSIDKTFSSGLVDTYTNTFSNGTMTTFTVTNGEPAGFGTSTVRIDGNVGVPYVEISESGPATARAFDFFFHNLKGEKGDKGNVNFATFEINLTDGNLYMTTDVDYTGANFEINSQGYLEVVI